MGSEMCIRDRSSGDQEGFETIPNTYLMYEQLLARGYPNLELQIDILEGETHMTSINPFALRGLGFVSKFANENED